jgi:hypothetical protein
MPTVTHTGNDYYVNTVTHSIQQQSNPLVGRALLAAGYIGPYSWGEAKGIVAGLAKEGVGGSAGLGAGSASGAGTSLGGAAQNLGGIAAIGDFFNRLTQAHTWIRVGEVIAGVLLAYIGLRAAFSGTAAGNVVKQNVDTAKRAAKTVATGAVVGA